MTDSKKWVAGWGAAISVLPQNYAEYVKDHTFRYVIFPNAEGDAVRLHFSNEYGTEPVTVTKVFIAKRASGESVVSGTSVPVTFGGETELHMGRAPTPSATGFRSTSGPERNSASACI